MKGGGRVPAVLAALTVGLVTSTAALGVDVVTDPIHTITNKIAWIAQYQQKYDQLRRQIQQYEAQIRDLEQKYVKGQAFKGGAGYRETLAERGLNDFVEETCGNSDALPKAPHRIAKISQRQLQNCIAIVQTENTRYNVMVKILSRLSERDREMDVIRRQAENVPEDQPGALDRVDNNIAQLEARLTTDVQNASTLLGAYDAALQALHTEQVRLGQAAFSDDAARKGGIAGLLDTTIQYGTLKAALGVARSRER
ncbi:hypothetical protein [Luteimonas sp. A482]